MNQAQKLGLYRHLYTIIGTLLLAGGLAGLPSWVTFLFDDTMTNILFSVIGGIFEIIGLWKSYNAPEKNIDDATFEKLTSYVSKGFAPNLTIKTVLALLILSGIASLYSCQEIQSQDAPQALELRTKNYFSDTVDIFAPYALPTLRLRDDVGAWYYQMFAGDLIFRPEFLGSKAKIMFKNHMGSVVGSYNPNTGLLTYHDFITIDPIARTVKVEGQTIYRAGQWNIPITLINRRG